jgi:hypothetical protein
MKLFCAALLLLFASCNNEDKKESVSMPGAYSMLSQHVKGDKVDTSYSLQQLKIFTGDYMMYANINSPDSVSSFGVGTYTAAGDSVLETVLFNAYDSTSDDTARTYTLHIEKTDKGYKQVIREIGSADNKVTLTEEYGSVGTGSSSPLDGAWKQVKRYWIKGTDTTSYTPVQYKFFWSGHCAWGNVWTDSTNKKYTGIGFGTFTLTGDKLKESMKASTYWDVRGQDFDITIAMDGKDGFTQTMNNSDGTKSLEVYVRMKK